MHWHYDFKLVSSLVGLLYSPVTIFTGKKSLGHPVALLKANQIWFRFRPRKKRKKEKHYLCDLTFGLWYWPSRVILNSTGPLLYAQCTCVDHEGREMNLKSNTKRSMANYTVKWHHFWMCILFSFHSVIGHWPFAIELQVHFSSWSTHVHCASNSDPAHTVCFVNSIAKSKLWFHLLGLLKTWNLKGWW